MNEWHQHLLNELQGITIDCEAELFHCVYAHHTFTSDVNCNRNIFGRWCMLAVVGVIQGIFIVAGISILLNLIRKDLRNTLT